MGTLLVGCTPGLRFRFKGGVTVRRKVIVMARCFRYVALKRHFSRAARFQASQVRAPAPRMTARW